jgi:hypothetical protein
VGAALRLHATARCALGPNTSKNQCANVLQASCYRVAATARRALQLLPLPLLCEGRQQLVLQAPTSSLLCCCWASAQSQQQLKDLCHHDGRNCATKLVFVCWQLQFPARVPSSAPGVLHSPLLWLRLPLQLLLLPVTPQQVGQAACGLLNTLLLLLSLCRTSWCCCHNHVANPVTVRQASWGVAAGSALRAHCVHHHITCNKVCTARTAASLCFSVHKILGTVRSTAGRS